jgi:hypothetical protein
MNLLSLSNLKYRISLRINNSKEGRALLVLHQLKEINTIVLNRINRNHLLVATTVLILS